MDYYSEIVTLEDNCFAPPTGCLEAITTGSAQIVMDGAPSEVTTGADSVKLQQHDGSSWNDVHTVSGNSPFLLVTSDTAHLRFRWAITADSEVSYSTEGVITHDCCGSELGDLFPPIPDKPTAIIDWPNETITVEAPAWPTGVYADGLRQELQRSLDNTNWADVTTWEAADGTWYETPAEAFKKYYYRVRNCNSAGCSDWSEVLLVQIISASAEVTWLSPENNSTVTNAVDLRFHAVDGGGASNPRIMALPGGTVAPVGRNGGTAADGQYAALWHTQKYFEGAITLRALVTGSDGLPAYADLAVTVSNAAATWPQYREAFISEPHADREIFALRVSVETGPLSPADLYRYWISAGVNNAQSSDWDDYQKFPLAMENSWPARGITPAGKVFSARRGIDRPGNPVYVKLRAEPAVAQRLWSTGLDEVTQITEIEPGLHWILARNTDGSAARIYEYDGTTLSLRAELGDFAAESTFAFAPALVTSGDATAPDGVLCATSNGLLLVDQNPDTEPLDAAQLITPINVGEAEPGTLTGLFPTASGVMLIYTGDNRTQAYLRGSLGIRPVWSLLVEADIVRWRGGKVLLASGQYLLSADSETATPSNVKMFADDIAVIDAGRVVLANGDLYEPDGNDWEQVTTFTSANALETWRGGREELFPVLGSDDLTLRWPDRAGQWGDGFTIAPPTTEPEFSSSGSGSGSGSASVAETPAATKVLSLGHFAIKLPSTVTAAPGGDEPPPVYDDRLLFGLDGGIFGELRMSKLTSADGAFLATGEEAITLIPTWRKKAEQGSGSASGS